MIESCEGVMEGERKGGGGDGVGISGWRGRRHPNIVSFIFVCMRSNTIITVGSTMGREQYAM